MKSILTLLLLVLAYSMNAQLKNYTFDGEGTMRFAVFYGKMTNEWSGKIEDETFGTVVIDYGNSKSTFGWGKYQNSHRYKILGDVISVLYAGNGLAEKPNIGTPTLTSIFGWHNFAFSAFYTNYVQLSAGAHIGDYFYGVEGIHTSRKSDQNTSGTIYYYGGVGPVVMADVSMFDSGVFLHYEGAYAFTWGEEPRPGYPDQKPNILNQMFELRFARMFFNVEVVYGLNDYGNRIKRQQFGIGISL